MSFFFNQNLKVSRKDTTLLVRTNLLHSLLLFWDEWGLGSVCAFGRLWMSGGWGLRKEKRITCQPISLALAEPPWCQSYILYFMKWALSSWLQKTVGVRIWHWIREWIHCSNGRSFMTQKMNFLSPLRWHYDKDWPASPLEGCVSHLIATRVFTNLALQD